MEYATEQLEEGILLLPKKFCIGGMVGEEEEEENGGGKKAAEGSGVSFTTHRGFSSPLFLSSFMGGCNPG